MIALVLVDDTIAQFFSAEGCYQGAYLIGRLLGPLASMSLSCQVMA